MTAYAISVCTTSSRHHTLMLAVGNFCGLRFNAQMNGIITIRTLGHNGRFGNMLHQYIFAKAYAKAIGAELQTPHWSGQLLFEGIHDPIVSNQDLPIRRDDSLPNGETNIDLCGFWTGQKASALWTRNFARETYRFKQCWIDSWNRPKPHYVAAHLRRGDFFIMNCPYFPVITEKSYKQAMEANGIDPNEVVWTTDGLGPPIMDPMNIQFVNDFLTLMHADILFMANSTFSWWAGMLGHSRVFVPLVEMKAGERDAAFVEQAMKPDASEGVYPWWPDEHLTR